MSLLPSTSVKTIRLNRLDLIGNIDEDTPLCVILDIARCNGIIFDENKLDNHKYIEELVSIIRKNISFEISLSIDELVSLIRNDGFHQPKIRNLSIIPNLIQYINPRSIYWTSNKDIITAFSHIQQYITDKPPLPKGNFTIGFKTPFNIMSYDSCMLYKICKCYQIRTDQKTSLDEMASAIKMMLLPMPALSELFSSLSKSDIISALINRRINPLIHSAVNQQIHSAVIESKEEKKFTNYDAKELIKINRIFSSSRELIRRIVPESAEEAVILAAKNYDLDISESIYPIDEYKNLRQLSKHNEDILMIQQEYSPIDPQFRKHYKQSRWWYNIKSLWKPLFSFLYTQNRLIEFALSEGFTQAEIEASTPENLLHMSRVTSTFYPGTNYFSININSPIDQDTISELKDSGLVCYGALDDRKIVTFKLSELNSHFLNYRAFLNPFDLKEVFSPRSIRKLKILTKDVSLSRTILTLQQNTTKQFERLLNLYKNSSLSIQENIVTALRNLLETSFYMRGWKVSTNNFPLTKETTVFPSEKEAEVHLNTTMAISKYEKFLDQLPENVVSEIKSLPLLGISKRKDDGSLEFIPQTNRDQGLTITDRLEIVKIGKSVYSCIRLSSNYLAISVYYYLHLITGIEPFDINQFGYNVT